MATPPPQTSSRFSQYNEYPGKVTIESGILALSQVSEMVTTAIIVECYAVQFITFMA